MVAVLYRCQSLNLHTQNREERDLRGEEIKCGKTLPKACAKKKNPKPKTKNQKKPPKLSLRLLRLLKLSLRL